jgi:hypothetical protein
VRRNEKILETYSLPRLNHEETEKSKHTNNNKIKSVIKNLLIKTSTGPDNLTGKII